MQHVDASKIKKPKPIPKEDRHLLPRVKVFSVDGQPLTPTDFRQARVMVERGVAQGRHVGKEYELHMLKPLGKKINTD